MRLDSKVQHGPAARGPRYSAIGGARPVKALCAAVLATATALCLLAPSALLARQKSPKDYTIQIPPAPDYSSLEWLLGVWSGKTTGKGAQGQVVLSLAYELGKRFMVFREEVSLPATKEVPATHEGVMGLLHASDAGGFEMDLYSSNGFITHYRVIAKHGLVTFSPQGGALSPPGWLFRRDIRHTNPRECTEGVEVAPPGENFFNYYSADLFQVTSSSAAPEKSHPKSGGSEGGAPGE